MPKETMNPRERWLAVLTRRLPDRTPLDYWATEEFNARLLSYLGEADLRTALQKLHVDFVVTATPRYVGPAHARRDRCLRLPLSEDRLRHRHLRRVHIPPAGAIQLGGGDRAQLPLARAGLVGLQRRYQSRSRGWEDYPIRGGGSEPFLTYKSLRGQEQAFMDLVLHPDIVHYCLDKLFGLAYAEHAAHLRADPGTGAPELCGGGHGRAGQA